MINFIEIFCNYFRVKNSYFRHSFFPFCKKSWRFRGLSDYYFLKSFVSQPYFYSFSVVNILPVSSTTEYKWFAVDQLDISMDGNDAIVLCSWDGMTYVIDKDFETVSYSFGDNICGFRAGMYAIDAGVNVPCFSYVTFLNRLVLFYDVRGIYLRSNNLYETLIKKLQSSDKYGTVLKSLKDETGNIDFNRLRLFVKSTLSS